MFNLLKENGIEMVNKNTIVKNAHNSTLGIGDLLFTILLLKHHKIAPPIYINLTDFHKYFPNPQNALDFRIKLLKYFCQHNNVDFNSFKFTENINLPKHGLMIIIKSMPNLRLNLLTESIIIPNELINKEYIIFHTKCRFSNTYPYYELLKKELIDFCKKYKSKYQIVLLGERTFPSTFEGDQINITTVYQELKNLNHQNQIIDLTESSIYNNLNFYKYLVDMKIISNAKLNVIFGCGGQFCNTLMFGNKTYALWHKCIDDCRINSIYPEVSYFYGLSLLMQKLKEHW
jgi:hypothetical protein